MCIRDRRKACGYKKNGNRLVEQNNALHQLEETFIYYHSRAFLKSKGENKRDKLRLISVERTLKPGTEKVLNYKITVDPLFCTVLKKSRKFFTVNADRISELEPAAHCFAVIVTIALTRRYICLLYTSPSPRDRG